MSNSEQALTICMIVMGVVIMTFAVLADWRDRQEDKRLDARERSIMRGPWV